MGCDPAGTNEVAIEDEMPTTRERLREQAVFEVIPEASQATLIVRINRGNRWLEYPVAARITGGHVDIGAADDGTVSIDDFQLDIADMKIQPGGEVLSQGLHLTRMRARLANEVQGTLTEWDDAGERCTATFEAPLLLEWAVLADGRPVQLGPQKLEPIGLRASISHNRNSPAYELHLSGSNDGVLWQWAELVELSRLGLDVGGQAGQPGDAENAAHE